MFDTLEAKNFYGGWNPKIMHRAAEAEGAMFDFLETFGKNDTAEIFALTEGKSRNLFQCSRENDSAERGTRFESGFW